MSSMSSLLGLSGLAFVMGLVLVALAFVLIFVLRGKGMRPAVGVGLLGVVVIVLGLVGGALAPAATTTPPIAPPAAACAVQLASAPALATGETWNTISNTLTVDLVYNKTSNFFFVSSTVGASTSKPNYVLFPIKLVRTDPINQTFSFPVSIASIPTANSLGATPTTYSVVGNTPATSTTPGIWQAYFSAGTLANQKPTVSAPSVSTNVISDGTPVTSFGSVTSVLHISLAGGNSTSAPTLFAEALQNYTSYPMTVSVGNGSPSLLTIDFILIGWF